jgi:hypothetical protein
LGRLLLRSGASAFHRGYSRVVLRRDAQTFGRGGVLSGHHTSRCTPASPNPLPACAGPGAGAPSRSPAGALPAAAGWAGALAGRRARSADGAGRVTDDREGVAALRGRDDRVGGRSTGRRHRQGRTRRIRQRRLNRRQVGDGSQSRVTTAVIGRQRLSSSLRMGPRLASLSRRARRPGVRDGAARAHRSGVHAARLHAHDASGCRRAGGSQGACRGC